MPSDKKPEQVLQVPPWCRRSWDRQEVCHMERGASSELPRSVQIPILFFLPFLGCFHFWSFRVYSDFQQSCRDQHVYACPMPPPMTPHFPVARSVSVQSESEIVSHTNLSGFRRQWGFIDAVKSAAVTLFVLCCLFRVVFPAAPLSLSSIDLLRASVFTFI